MATHKDLTPYELNRKKELVIFKSNDLMKNLFQNLKVPAQERANYRFSLPEKRISGFSNYDWMLNYSNDNPRFIQQDGLDILDGNFIIEFDGNSDYTAIREFVEFALWNNVTFNCAFLFDETEGYV